MVLPIPASLPIPLLRVEIEMDPTLFQLDTTNALRPTSRHRDTTLAPNILDTQFLELDASFIMQVGHEMMSLGPLALLVPELPTTPCKE